MKIEVEKSGVVELQQFKDPPDGDLFIAEALKNIPFEIKRIYFINHLGNPHARRGQHAHRELQQVIFCINGTFTLKLDDGQKQQAITLNNPATGIILKPMLWHEMTNFSENCVILVLANDYYQEEDYIRSYEEFQRQVKQQPPA